MYSLLKVYQLALELDVITIYEFESEVRCCKEKGLIKTKNKSKNLDIPFTRVYDLLVERSLKTSYRDALREYMHRGFIHIDNVDRLKGTDFERQLKRQLVDERYFHREHGNDDEFLLF